MILEPLQILFALAFAKVLVLMAFAKSHSDMARESNRFKEEEYSLVKFSKAYAILSASLLIALSGILYTEEILVGILVMLALVIGSSFYVKRRLDGWEDEYEVNSYKALFGYDVRTIHGFSKVALGGGAFILVVLLIGKIIQGIVNPSLIELTILFVGLWIFIQSLKIFNAMGWRS